jgi:hypothetical protein
MDSRELMVGCGAWGIRSRSRLGRDSNAMEG